MLWAVHTLAPSVITSLIRRQLPDYFLCASSVITSTCFAAVKRKGEGWIRECAFLYTLTQAIPDSG